MADKRPSKNVEFGPVVLSYPHLNKPDDKFGDAYYRADGVEDPNSAAMKAAKAIFSAALKEFGLEPDARLPLVKETQKDPKAPEGAKKVKRVPTGKLLLKAKTKRIPALVDAHGKPINPATVEIGGGSIAYLQGYIAPYEMKGEEGISFTLTGVQITKLVERGGGATFKDRSAEGDYSYDGPSAKNVPDDADDLNIGDDSDDADQDDGGVLDI